MTAGKDGYVSFRGYKVWYRTAGDLRKGVPLVLLHGGPGIPGNAYDPLMEQLADSRPSVRYDQLGCGRSDRPSDPSLWCVKTFLDELTALRDALALDTIHLLGHSWGGCSPSSIFCGGHEACGVWSCRVRCPARSSGSRRRVG